MFKKSFKFSIVALALSLFLAMNASAMPAELDPTEPNNNSAGTSYWFSQNVFSSYIQYSGDPDFWNFIAPKTVSQQEIWLLPPYGNSYLIAIFEYGSGTPIASTWSSGNMTSIYVDLVQGRAYTVLVLAVDGSYDVDRPYYIGFPYLFPYY